MQNKVSRSRGEFMIYKSNMSEEEYKKEIADKIFYDLKYIPNSRNSRIDFAVTDKDDEKKH